MISTIYKQLSEKRKAEQAEGVLPEWVTTAGYQMFTERYLYKANNMKEQFERIASTAAKHLPKKHQEEGEKKFFELMWKGWLSCSTPVLANMGTNRGLPVSCSGSVIEDSIDGFYSAAREAAILTKHGFGTSSYLGDIRPRGTEISTGGKASGVVPVFKHFVNIMRDVSQAGIRRGSWAGYLPIDHGDFDELADYVKDNPDDANVGWNISDEFIEKLKNQDPDAIRRYKKAMKLKILTGKGYFYFIDEVNRQNPEMYEKHGLKVRASNLCLAGDTKITVHGEEYGMKVLTMKEFVDEWFDKDTWKVWSYNTETKTGEWNIISDAVMTNKSAKLMRITDSETGKSITCTPEHKIYTKNRGYVMAKDLREDDELVIG
jgi:ribonucleoside-diphosphate reductase alpha chain